MKSQKIKKVLKTIIISESVMLATFIPPVARVVGSVNRSVQIGLASVNGVASTMASVAVAHPFGFSNLYFLALLLVAIALPTLDIILGIKKGDAK